jgi:hypothetical protein
MRERNTDNMEDGVRGAASCTQQTAVGSEKKLVKSVLRARANSAKIDPGAVL